MALPFFPSWIGEGVSGANSWGIKLPVKKTPSFRSLHHTPANNQGEINVALTTFPVWIFELNLAWMRGNLTLAQVGSAFQQIVGFYGEVQGSAGSWLFFDPYDNGSNLTTTSSLLGSSSLVQNLIGAGDGSTKTFLTTRSIGGGLYDVVQNFVSGYPLVYVGGSLQSSSAYSLDQYGNLTFNSAPGAGQQVSWYGQFYFRCRFLEDEWQELAAMRVDLWHNPSLKFKSLIL